MTLVMDDPAETRRRQQKSRNRAMLILLLALVALFYAISIAKMSGG